MTQKMKYLFDGNSNTYSHHHKHDRANGVVLEEEFKSLIGEIKKMLVKALIIKER